jgi:hypothetical protein
LAEASSAAARDSSAYCAACRFAVGAGGTVAQAPTMKHVRRLVAKGRRAGSRFRVDRFIIMFPLKLDWRAAAAMLLFQLQVVGNGTYTVDVTREPGVALDSGWLPTRMEKWFTVTGTGSARVVDAGLIRVSTVPKLGSFVRTVANTGSRELRRCAIHRWRIDDRYGLSRRDGGCPSAERGQFLSSRSHNIRRKVARVAACRAP